MEDLPDSLLLHVFSFLDYENLCLGVRMTSGRFRRLSHDPELWRMVEIPEHFNDERFLLLLASIYPHVEELECSKCEQLTKESFLKLAQLCLPRLKKLAVPIIVSFPDKVYARLMEACPVLEELENLRPNLEDTCDPLLCQALVPSLKVVHDKPVSTYGRLRKLEGKAKKKRGKWYTALATVASACPDVTTYCCNRGMDFLEDNAFEKISIMFPYLRLVELRHCTITDSGLQRFFAYNRAGGLRELIMDRPGEISDKGLQAIADACTGLTNLKLSRCLKVTNSGVKYLVKKCRELTELHLNNAEAVLFNKEGDAEKTRVDFDDECLTCIAENCRNLQYFRLFYSEKVTVQGLSHIVDGCPYLTGLMLFECPKVDDQCLDVILKLRFLKALVMVNSEGITPKGVIDLVLMAPSLVRLTLYNKNRLFYGDLSQLAEDTYNKIDVDTGCFRPNVIKRITLRGVGGGFIQLLTVLCPSLHTLDLREANSVTVPSLACVIRNCENLKNLDASTLKSVDDDFLLAVSENALQLRSLALGTTVAHMSTAAIARVFSECPSLSMVSMDTFGTAVDEEELACVARHHHGGHCYVSLPKDPWAEASPRSRYVEFHFTPKKYLGSVRLQEPDKE